MGPDLGWQQEGVGTDIAEDNAVIDVEILIPRRKASGRVVARHVGDIEIGTGQDRHELVGAAMMRDRGELIPSLDMGCGRSPTFAGQQDFLGAHDLLVRRSGDKAETSSLIGIWRIAGGKRHPGIAASSAIWSKPAASPGR